MKRKMSGSSTNGDTNLCHPGPPWFPFILFFFFVRDKAGDLTALLGADFSMTKTMYYFAALLAQQN